MPKVRPLTQEQKEAARWTKADRNFRRQIDEIADILGFTPKQVIGFVLKTTHYQTIKRFYDDPSRMTKKQERDFASFFEKNGLPFDMTWGEGGKGNAAVVN